MLTDLSKNAERFSLMMLVIVSLPVLAGRTSGHESSRSFAGPSWAGPVAPPPEAGIMQKAEWAEQSRADGKPHNAQDRFMPRTGVSIREGRWYLNGRITYPGAAAEGLLMNVRMVNAVFEDRNRSDFDPEANTDRFIARIPDYVAQGVRAFTLCLQGGMPGYEGALNSGFNPDGSLRRSYLRRVRRVIEACDGHGAVVILGLYYQRQDQVLADDDAVRAGVVNAVRWITDSGFANVVLEIANEFGHGGFDHRLLKTAEGMTDLIKLAKATSPALLVSTSGLGDGRSSEGVARASDFLLIHFNNTRLEDIGARIAALRRFGKPIVCNEDDKTGAEGARVLELAVAHGASWGLMLVEVNQHYPFTFKGAADDPIIYAAMRRMTSISQKKPFSGMMGSTEDGR